MGYIFTIKKRNILNEKIGLVRAIAASGTLFTIAFNNIALITHKEYIIGNSEIVKSILFQKVSLFNLLPPIYAKYLSVFLLLIVISGLFPRITCFLHAWICLSVTNSFVSIDGGDQIAANLSILLIPICLCDRRVTQWSKSINKSNEINTFTNVAFFFIQLQVAIIYLHSAIGKLTIPEWYNGTASYYWISNPNFGAPDWLKSLYEEVTLSKGVFVLTWFVIIFELSLFSCIFASKRVKKLFLLPAIGFHFLIILTHGLFSFFFSMTAMLIVYLDDSNQSIELIRKLKYWFWQSTNNPSRRLQSHQNEVLTEWRLGEK